MEQITCKNCNGEGIVGNGPNPAAKEGHLHGCGVCAGTGKVTVGAETSQESQGQTIKEEVETNTDDTHTNTETANQDGGEKKDEVKSDTEGGEASVSDQLDSSLG